MADKDIELYIHIPFCAKKCSYCDFLSFPAGMSDQKMYIDALIKEIEYSSDKAQDYCVRSVFIGGGTPSLINPQQIEKIMNSVNRLYDVAENAEITIEANPCTINAEKLDVYLTSGINRISIGCQSVNDDNLRLLGRLHDHKTFIEAYKAVKSAGFENINIDMMYGLPYQTVEEWQYELEEISELDIRHISAYSLILEEETPMYKLKDELEFPDEDAVAEMFAGTKRILSANGFQRYEISNYAKSGYESKHNTGYWTGIPYLGLGLGAASYFNDLRWSNTSDIYKYLSLSNGGGIEESIQPLSIKDKQSEFVILGLRLTEGISCSCFSEKFKEDIFEIYGKELTKHIKCGTLVREDDRIYIPDEYMFVSNSIMADFI